MSTLGVCPSESLPYFSPSLERCAVRVAPLPITFYVQITFYLTFLYLPILQTVNEVSGHSLCRDEAYGATAPWYPNVQTWKINSNFFS